MTREHIFAVVLLISSSVASQETNLTNDELPVVMTSYGKVQGSIFLSPWTKKEIYSFRGIPYAAPPLHNLRFKDPVPPEKWSDIKNCTEDENICPQLDIFGLRKTPLKTDENCLFINVYTPQINTKDTLLPVMVWVHGGAYFAGSGNYDTVGPDFLVAEGVVVVTFNYRLGALGFLSLEMPEAPGNAGMKDQLLALQWVQKEIQQFGGNPGSVTLFGESAGSAAVHLHYLSPLSKGLFHRVIGESGAVLGSRWSVRNNSKTYGLKLASALNCSTSTLAIALKCLTEADAQAIVEAQHKLVLEAKDSESGLSLAFIPSIDRMSKKPFLPDDPNKMFQEDQGSFVPFIMGINSDEGMMALGVTKDEEKIKNITNNLKNFIPPDVRSESTESRLEFLVKRIRAFYFKDTPPSISNLRGYVDLFTDTMFGYSTAISARAFRDRASVYLYLFAFNGEFKEKLSEIVQQTYNFTGVSHAEELSYLFVRQKVNQTAADDSAEMKTWKKMAKLWTNFAKHGTPTLGIDPDLDSVIWSPIGNVTTHYLRIDRKLTMVSDDYLGPQVALWDSITPSRSGYLQATAVLILLFTTLILYFTK